MQSDSDEVCKIDKTVLTVEYWLPVDSDASLSDKTK